MVRLVRRAPGSRSGHVLEHRHHRRDHRRSSRSCSAWCAGRWRARYRIPRFVTAPTRSSATPSAFSGWSSSCEPGCRASGSIVTYLGLVSAGLAVALQEPIANLVRLWLHPVAPAVRGRRSDRDRPPHRRRRRRAPLSVHAARGGQLGEGRSEHRPRHSHSQRLGLPARHRQLQPRASITSGTSCRSPSPSKATGGWRRTC